MSPDPAAERALVDVLTGRLNADLEIPPDASPEQVLAMLPPREVGSLAAAAYAGGEGLPVPEPERRELVRTSPLPPRCYDDDVLALALEVADPTLPDPPEGRTVADLPNSEAILEKVDELDAELVMPRGD